MKVEKIEKEEFEEVWIDGNLRYRFDADSWMMCLSDGWAKPDMRDELEAAYQQFKNPPFEIRLIENDNNFSCQLNIKIGNCNFLTEKYSKSGALVFWEELEKALNSLINKQE